MAGIFDTPTTDTSTQSTGSKGIFDTPTTPSVASAVNSIKTPSLLSRIGSGIKSVADKIVGTEFPTAKPAPAVLKGTLIDNPKTQAILGKDYVQTPYDTPGKLLSHDLSQIFNQPIEIAGDTLGSTKVFQNAAKGSDMGKFLPSFTEELAKRLQVGTEAISGATGGLVQPDINGAPDDISTKLFSTLSQAIGMATGVGELEGLNNFNAPKVILDNFENYPKIQTLFNSLAKTIPAFSEYGQLNPNLNGASNRIKTLGIDIATAIPYTALGLFSNKLITVPVSAALGFSLAKLSGASNKDAAISATALGLLSAMGPSEKSSKELITQQQAKGQLYDEAINTINKFTTNNKIDKNSTPSEIKTAYFEAAHQTHPDKGGNDKDFSAATYARDVLLGEGKTTEAKITNTQTPEDKKVDIEKMAEDIKNGRTPSTSSDTSGFKVQVPKDEVENIASQFTPKESDSPYDTPITIAARNANRNISQTQKIDTPERKELRTKIVEKLYGEGASKKNKRLDIVTGGPGMRKSTMIAEPLAKQHGSLIIDADIAKRELPEFNGGKGSTMVHAESSYISRDVRNKGFENGDNMVLTTIGDSQANMDRLVDIAKEHGYEVHLHNVQLPLEKSIPGVVNRFETGEQGFVDPKYAERVGLKPTEIHDNMKGDERISSQTKYSTDVEKGQKAKVLETSSTEGSSERYQEMDSRGDRQISQGSRGINNNFEINDRNRTEEENGQSIGNFSEEPGFINSPSERDKPIFNFRRNEPSLRRSSQKAPLDIQTSLNNLESDIKDNTMARSEGRLAEYLRENPRSSRELVAQAQDFSAGKPVKITNATFPILSEIGFSENLIQKLQDTHVKGATQNIIISDTYQGNDLMSGFEESNGGTLYLNPTNMDSESYQNGDIIKHELDGHAWYSQLSNESKQSFYDNLKVNKELIKDAWDQSDNDRDFYWRDSINKIRQAVVNTSSEKVAQNIVDEFIGLSSDPTITPSLDSFITQTLNFDKTINIINDELVKRGYNPINLNAYNLPAVKEHGAMIAENSSALVAPEEGALNNYIQDIKNGTLKYGPTAERALTYQGETDLTIKTLEKLKGRDTVSKQFISDLTNSPNLKQVERELVRNILAGYPDGAKIPVAQFAKDVKIELVPLKRRSAGDAYEPVTLPDNLRGDIDKYEAFIYNSPIKTSAGNIHFGDKGEPSKNYFGHTRVEDVITGDQGESNTRRVIEVQSDLYQKGNLEKETKMRVARANEDIGYNLEKEGEATVTARFKVAEDKAQKEVDQLQQYNDPTAHFRMVREEIRKAAQDGKTKLQFPTGETAMKIEGLGQGETNRFIIEDPKSESIRRKLEISDLKIGQEIKEEGELSGGWIITDVLGDGKFKAVPKGHLLDNPKGFGDAPTIKIGNQYGLLSFQETFDISRKVDTSNPIYRFYEKDLGRYLKNNYNAVPVTDDKGVTWNEINIKPEMATEPVVAFRKGTQDIEQLRRMLERTQQSLDAAVAQPEAHELAYGPGKVEQYKARIADIKNRIAEIKTPSFDTGNKLEDARLALQAVQDRVGAPSIIPEKITISGVKIPLPEELTDREDALKIKQDYIEQSPLNKLIKYSNKKEGTLPEVTGEKGKGLFTKNGDQIVSSDEFQQFADFNSNGHIDSEVVRNKFEQFIEEKKELEQERKQLAIDKKIYINNVKDELIMDKLAKKDALTYQQKVDELNPPKVRGDLSSPRLNFPKWKDVAAVRLSRDTFERNIEKVAPPEDVAKLKEFIIDPIKKNDTDMVEYANKIKLEARAKMKELNIKRNSKEDELIQRWGEGLMKEEELQKEAGKRAGDIKKAATFYRNVYDKMIDDWNEVRKEFGYKEVRKRKDYFRHFDDINFITQNFGFLKTPQELPTSIAGETEFFKPGKPFTTAEMRRTGNRTKYSAIGGLNNYIDSVGRQIFHIDSIQRGRALIKYLNAASRIGEQTGERINLQNFKTNLLEYVNNGLAGKTSAFDRITEQYAGRRLFKFFTGLSSVIGKNIIVGNISAALSHLVTFPMNLATVDKIPFTKGLMVTLTSPFSKNDFNMIDGQKSAYLTRRFPEKNILSTIPEKIENGGKSIMMLSDRFKTKTAVAGKYFEGIKNGLSKTDAMKQADEYAGRLVGDNSIGQIPNLMNTKTMSVFTQFERGLNDSISVLMHDIPGQKSGFGKGKGDTDEVNKKRVAWQLFQFAVFSFLFNKAIKDIRGSGRGIDPIDLGLTLTGMNDEGAPLSPLGRVAAAGKDIAGELPFTNLFTGNFPVTEAMPNIAGLVTGKTTYGAEAERLIADLASPFGGGLQAKKTIEGLLAYTRGYATSNTGAPTNPIAQTKANLVRAFIFGPSGTSGAEDYYNKTNEGKAYSTIHNEIAGAQTKLNKLDPSIVKPAQDAWDQVKKLGVGTDEANAVVDNLSDEEYTAYKDVKASDASYWQEIASKVTPIVKQANELGFGTSEADALIEPLSDDEYKIYGTVKNALYGKDTDTSPISTTEDSATWDKQSFINHFVNISKAISTDPKTAFNDIFAGNSSWKITQIKNGQIIVERNSKAEAAQKKALGGGSDVILDHIKSFELGGNNANTNMWLIPKDQSLIDDQVENYLGKALKDGNITGKQAQEYELRYKKGADAQYINTKDQKKLFNSVGDPLTLDEVKSLISQ